MKDGTVKSLVFLVFDESTAEVEEEGGVFRLVVFRFEEVAEVVEARDVTLTRTFLLVCIVNEVAASSCGAMNWSWKCRLILIAEIAFYRLLIVAA